jgi:hypothetical protein
MKIRLMDRDGKRLVHDIVLGVTIVIIIAASGCTSPQSTAQNLENATVPLAGNLFFTSGDIISPAGNTFGNGRLVLGYDPERDNYQYVFAWKTDSGIWTFNKNYQIEVIRRDVIERENYEKLTNIKSSSIEPIPTMFQSMTNTTQSAENICDEWFACGFGFGNFQGEPAGLSQRCHELYEMRMQNDQRVMTCLKNPYEASGNNAVAKLHCMQGVGTVEECAKYGIKLDRDNGNVIN